jgi:hypothetical protein
MIRKIFWIFIVLSLYVYFVSFEDKGVLLKKAKKVYRDLKIEIKVNKLDKK